MKLGYDVEPEGPPPKGDGKPEEAEPAEASGKPADARGKPADARGKWERFPSSSYDGFFYWLNKEHLRKRCGLPAPLPASAKAWHSPAHRRRRPVHRPVRQRYRRREFRRFPACLPTSSMQHRRLARSSTSTTISLVSTYINTRRRTRRQNPLFSSAHQRNGWHSRRRRVNTDHQR